MKLRRIFATLLVVLLTLSLTACSQKDTLADVPEELRPYVTPWKLDVVRKAADNKELHFYFMSGEGFEASPGNTRGQTEKWGDCCLVVFPDGQTMLIDSGFAVYTPILMQNLKRMGIEKLDYVMLSHPHTDHYGGFLATDGVLATIPVTQAYHNGYNQSMHDKFGAYNVPLQTLLTGDTLTIGGVKLTVLSPDQNQLDHPTESNKVTNENNASLVVRMDYGEFSALFTGDLYVGEERRLVKEYAASGLLNVDFLKLPHHGDSTSSTLEFANAVTPKLAAATGAVPINNTIYMRYAQYAETVLHDLNDGYVHVWSDGSNSCQWETSRERETDIYDAYDAMPKKATD